MGEAKERTITVFSYGKINLSLDVLGLTDDGFHEVEMVMQAIKLHDNVEVGWAPQPGKESASGEGDIVIRLHTNLPYVPDDERNIAYKAARLMAERFPQEAGDPRRGIVKIDIHKRIPVAAGLAGGSGNGAAVVMALNKLWNLGLSLKELMELGGELGSDVPFSVMSQAACNGFFGFKKDPLASTCAVARGRGVELEPVRALSANVVLCKPPISVSTKEVYQGIDHCEILRRPDNKALVEAIADAGGELTEASREAISRNMVNVLEYYTLNRYDIVKALKNKIVQIAGQDGIVLMTGSGPTVFALLEKREAAGELARKSREGKSQTFITRTLV